MGIRPNTPVNALTPTNMKKFYFAGLALLACAVIVVLNDTNTDKPAITIQPATADLSKLPPLPGMAKPGTNPAHGQPGHLCDLPVGAALNTPAASSSTPAVAATPPQIVQNTVVQANATPQNNPPHGQPGHRCDIAVGASLTAQPAVNQQPVNASPATPAAVPQLAQNTATAPASGIKPQKNPPHGQPYHRCDVAVGATL